MKIKNFQCHKDQEFELDPGVNVFVGKSGAGKSAGVIRPLKWLAFNRPLGDSFRRWGSDTTWTEIQLAEGVNIARKKSDKENCYEMLEGVKDMQYFSSFGQTPPESVQSALNLSQINFQFQHDQLYLLSYSPPEVARVLNELTGLDKIDKAFSNINSRLRRETQETSANQSIKEKLEKDLDKYKDLDFLDSSLMVAEQLENQVTGKILRASSLRSSSSRIRNAEERISEFDGLERLKDIGSEAQAKLNLLNESSKRKIELYTLAEMISSKKAKIQCLERMSGLGKELEKLQVGIIGKKGMELQAEDIRTMASKKMSLDLQIGEMEIVLEDLHYQFDKEMPEQCPLCGRTE